MQTVTSRGVSSGCSLLWLELPHGTCLEHFTPVISACSGPSCSTLLGQQQSSAGWFGAGCHAVTAHWSISQVCSLSHSHLENVPASLQSWCWLVCRLGELAGRARWRHAEFHLWTWQQSCCLWWPPRWSYSRKWSLPTPWWIYHPMLSLLSHSHHSGLVHGSSKVVPSSHWSMDQIFVRLSTWVFSGIWCSSEHGLWHNAVEPGNVAESVPAFFVAAMNACLQLVDGWWRFVLTPYQSHLGGCLWLAALAYNDAFCNAAESVLSSLSVVTVRRPLLGRSLMFPVCL